MTTQIVEWDATDVLSVQLLVTKGRSAPVGTLLKILRSQAEVALENGHDVDVVIRVKAR